MSIALFQDQLVPTILMPGHEAGSWWSPPLWKLEWSSLQPTAWRNSTFSFQGSFGARISRTPNGRGTQMAQRASLSSLEIKWRIRNCQLIYQKHRDHMNTNLTWLPCSPNRNQWATTEAMGLSGAPGHCTRTQYTWQKQSPYFSVGLVVVHWVSCCSEQEIEQVFLRTGQQFPGGRNIRQWHRIQDF